MLVGINNSKNVGYPILCIAIIGMFLGFEQVYAECTDPNLGGGTGDCRSNQYLHPPDASSAQAMWGAPAPRVIDVDTGEPIGGAVMYVCGARQRAVSRADGTFPSGFHFCGISTQKDYEFEVVIRHKDYKPVRFRFTVRYGQKVNIPSEVLMYRVIPRPQVRKPPTFPRYREPGQIFLLIEVLNAHTGAPIQDAKVILRSASGNPYKLKTDASGICLLRGHKKLNETVKLNQVYTSGGFNEWRGEEVFYFWEDRGDQRITIYLTPSY